jgi:hypothetical protein
VPSAPPEPVSVALSGVHEASKFSAFAVSLRKWSVLRVLRPTSVQRYVAEKCEFHVVGSHVESTAMVVARQVVKLQCV